MIKQTEFLAFDITLQQQELTYLQAQIQYNTDYLTLNYLSGINDTSIALLEQPDLKLAVFGDLNTSVFVTRFRTDSLRIENEKKILGYLYKPQIGAYTDAGYNSTLTHLPYRNFGFSFGLSLRIPIYDGHQKNLRYQQLSIQEDLRRSNQEFYTAQYRQQINVLRSQLQATENLFSKIDTQVRYTKTLITAYSKLFQTGDIRITELITAITSYLNAQNVLRQNIITGLRLRSQINYYNP